MAYLLLVEDDPFLVDIYTTKFKEKGFEIDSASDSDVAFRKMNEKKPDLLLLDIVLPNLDGWEILKKIRQDKNLNDLKVMILSNLSQKQEIDKAMNLGANKYLIKAHHSPSEVVEEAKALLEK
jgi:DNA-binding response OmpR family regulator